MFKVKYDGGEEQCDCIEPVVPRYAYLTKNVTVVAKLISPPSYKMSGFLRPRPEFES